MHMVNSAVRGTTFYADVFNNLMEAARCVDFKINDLKYRIKMMIERVRSQALRTAIEEHIRVESGLKNNIRPFIQRLKADARTWKEFG